MVQRFTTVRANGLTVHGAAREHQRRPGQCVRREASAHRALVVAIQMEEAVPRKHAVDTLTERQTPHVPDEPFGIGEATPAHLDQRRRRHSDRRIMKPIPKRVSVVPMSSNPHAA